VLVLVVTTDGSDERALVPEYGRGVRLEEMDELSKAGRSRNAHRVAVGRGGVGKEVWNGNYGRKMVGPLKVVVAVTRKI